MANVTQIIKNDNTKLEVVALPFGATAPTTYTFTVDGSVTQGATSIALDPVAPVALFAGDTLTFASVTVTLTADVAEGASSLAVASVSGTIADEATATTQALVELNGGDSVELSFGNESVDISSYGDGLFVNNAKVSINWSISLSGVYISQPAFEAVLVPLSISGSQATNEIYLKLTRGNGDVYTGRALVIDYSESYPLRDVLRFSCTLQGQGEITLTPAS